ncbi:hypothetical protein Tco_0786917, partial [Tanacetum coccineum]
MYLSLLSLNIRPPPATLSHRRPPEKFSGGFFRRTPNVFLFFRSTQPTTSLALTRVFPSPSSPVAVPPQPTLPSLPHTAPLPTPPPPPPHHHHHRTTPPPQPLKPPPM